MEHVFTLEVPTSRGVEPEPRKSCYTSLKDFKRPLGKFCEHTWFKPIFVRLNLSVFYSNQSHQVSSGVSRATTIVVVIHNLTSEHESSHLGSDLKHQLRFILNMTFFYSGLKKTLLY